jgi:hypothetical protein
MAEKKADKKKKSKINLKGRWGSYKSGYHSGQDVKGADDNKNYQKEKKETKDAYGKQETPEDKAVFRKGFQDGMNGKPPAGPPLPDPKKPDNTG